MNISSVKPNMRLHRLNRRRFLTASLTAVSAATLGLRLHAAEDNGLSFDPGTDII